MNEVQFVEKREGEWKRLNELCDRADVSPVNLKAGELEEIVRLYRRSSRDLGLARTKSTNSELIAFLNDLCARAYAILYRPRSRGFLSALVEALSLSAQTVRKRAWAIGLSAGIFVFSGVIAYVCLDRLPETRTYFVPPGAEPFIDEWRTGRMPGRDASISSAMTAFYMGNNPLVSIRTGAMSAATFGIGTVESMFANGAMIGALVHDLVPVGRVGYLFVHIMPHGVTELSGAIFAGAAGFVLAAALISPGRRRRGEALKEAGKDGIALLGTAIVLMFLAAPIEGFFSFNPSVPDALKIAFALASAIGWGLFWFGYGREPKATPEVLSSR